MKPMRSRSPSRAPESAVSAASRAPAAGASTTASPAPRISLAQAPRQQAQQQRIAQLHAMAPPAGGPVGNGLPAPLRAGIESLSGLDMSGVRVHRNSSKPAALQAHAYAQGKDIHLGPGQEQHLPHEAWHVVQQAQGRVRPTVQMKGGVAVNDDAGLEREADVMGARALRQGVPASASALDSSSREVVTRPSPKGATALSPTVQRHSFGLSAVWEALGASLSTVASGFGLFGEQSSSGVDAYTPAGSAMEESAPAHSGDGESEETTGVDFESLSRRDGLSHNPVLLASGPPTGAQEHVAGSPGDKAGSTHADPLPGNEPGSSMHGKEGSQGAGSSQAAAEKKKKKKKTKNKKTKNKKNQGASEADSAVLLDDDSFTIVGKKLRGGSKDPGAVFLKAATLVASREQIYKNRPDGPPIQGYEGQLDTSTVQALRTHAHKAPYTGAKPDDVPSLHWYATSSSTSGYQFCLSLHDDNNNTYLVLHVGKA